MTRPVRIDDLYAIPAVSDPVLSPDGSTVAYVVTVPDRDDDGYRSQVWTVATDGATAPRALTPGPRDTAPRWSPDGRSLAYLGESDGLAQVHLVDPTGGAPRRITQLAMGAMDPQWAPDGKAIAVGTITSLTEAGDPNAPVVIDRLGYKADGAGPIGDARVHLVVVDVETEKARQLTAGDFSLTGHRWSPDGTCLAYAAAAGRDSDRTAASAVYVVKLDGSTPRRVTPREAMLGTPTWLPDGEQLLVVGDERVDNGPAKLFVVPATGGDPKPVAELDRNVMTGGPGYPGAHPVVLEDGTILFAARDRGCTHLYTGTLDGPASKLVGAPDRSLSGLSVGAGLLTYVGADATSNSEVYVAAHDGSAERRLTHHLADALPDIELPTAEPRTFVAPDGTEVEGWLLRDPAAAAPGPLLLDIHGGPHNAWNGAFDGIHLYHHALVSAGWSVLLLNPRASDGYGEDFFRAAVGAWGVADDGDFLAAVDTLIQEGTVDPSRVVVTGYSYGGYMTSWLSARHPERWAAAIPGGLVANLTSMVGTADLGQLMGQFELGGTPWGARSQYVESSPITYVDDVTAPTLVLHGERDDRCPVSQAEEWFTSLRSRGVPTELVRYPGSSHVFILNGRPSHRVDWCNRIVDWSTRHTADGRRGRTLASRTRGLRARLQQLCELHNVPGAAVTVLHGDETVTAVTGVRSVEGGEPVTPRTTFQIGSNTKLYTATLVLQLVDAGLVDLDDPVVKHVPSFKLAVDGATEAITVRHLLTHTSGLPGDVFGMDIPAGDDAIARYVDDLAKLEPLHAAGELWSYCNAGWVVLGRLIENVTGETFAQAWRTRLLDPIGATRTRALPDEVVLLEPALGHVADKDGSPVVAPMYAISPASIPAGSMPASTGEDVVRFLRLHLDGGVTADGERLLQEKTVSLMQTAQVEVPGVGSLRRAWGLGWSLGETTDGRRIIGHGGGTLGQLSAVEVLPDERLAVVVLTNGMGGVQVLQTLVRELFSSLADAELLPDPVPLADASGVDLTTFEGEYVAASTRISVTAESEGLALVIRNTGLTGEVDETRATAGVLDASTFVSSMGGTVHFLNPDPDGRPTFLFAGRAHRREG